MCSMVPCQYVVPYECYPLLTGKCTAWTAPIQVTICLIILLVQLGPSALAGFSLFLLIMPIQERVMSFQFSLGKKTLRWTDARSRLILEVLGTHIIF